MFALDCYIHSIILHQLGLFRLIGPRSWPTKEVINNEIWKSYLVQRCHQIIIYVLIREFGSGLWKVFSWSFCAFLCHFGVVLDLRCHLIILLIIARLEKIDLSRDNLGFISWVIVYNRLFPRSMLSMANITTSLNALNPITICSFRQFINWNIHLWGTSRFTNRIFNTLTFDRHVLGHKLWLIIPRFSLNHLLFLLLF